MQNWFYRLLFLLFNEDSRNDDKTIDLNIYYLALAYTCGYTRIIFNSYGSSINTWKTGWKVAYQLSWTTFSDIEKLQFKRLAILLIHCKFVNQQPHLHTYLFSHLLISKLW